jgi:hypothetical protein
MRGLGQDHAPKMSMIPKVRAASDKIMRRK